MYVSLSSQPNGTPFQHRHGYRGRDRGRGMGVICCLHLHFKIKLGVCMLIKHTTRKFALRVIILN